jgi:hypothetical protein
MQDKYYCYELIDMRDNSVFYVGKGKGKRAYQHKKNALAENRKVYNHFLQRKILSILQDGYDININFVCFYENEKDAFEEEKRLISFYGKNKLCNLTDGGEGGDTFTNNPNKEEIRKKHSESSKGRKLSEKSKKIFSDVKKGEKNPNWKGRSCTEETRRKKSIAFAKEKNPFFGKKHSEEAKKRMSEKRLGKNNKNSILTEEQVLEIREKYSSGNYTQKELGQLFGVKEVTIFKIIKKITWKHI